MFADILMAAGALGLLLLGMDWLSKGLKASTGQALMQFLQHGTDKPLHGLLFGTGATVAVQSSTVSTVTPIGFVNAGGLSLHNAAFIIYGSNVGTSLTGWFVALVGLQIKIDALALPIIGLGAGLSLFISKGRWPGIGQALVGFGLFFLGLAFLQDSVNSAFIDIEFDALNDLGVWGLLVGVLLGTLLTVVMQASIATLALVIAATAAGVIPLSLAAAFVIGANLGTTSTALLSTLAATAKAKRLAMLHVIFNIVTGVAAIIVLAPLLAMITWIQAWFFADPNPAISLALFHTAFNVLGVVLMWPVTTRLVLWLNGRFRKRSSGQFNSLDRSSLAVPVVALATLQKETVRLAQIISTQGLKLAEGKSLSEEDMEHIRLLQSDLSEYMQSFAKSEINQNEAELLNQLVKHLLRLEMAYLLLKEFATQLQHDTAVIALEVPLWQAVSQACDENDSAAIRQAYRRVTRARQQHKQGLYQQVLRQTYSSEQAGNQLLQLAETRRFSQQLSRAMLGLLSLKK